MKNTIKNNRLYIEIEDVCSVRNVLTKLNISKKQMGILDSQGNIFIGTNKARLDSVISVTEQLSLPLYTQKDLEYISTEIELEVVYEDEIILIVNKPCNILTHTDESKEITLQNIVDNYLILNGNMITCNPIHRLDKETSGLIIYSKSNLFKAYFDRELADKSISRKYFALCDNPYKKMSRGKIEVYLAKDRHNSNMYRVAESGKLAITNYEVIRNYSSYSLLRLHLDTGRTHQIRVSLAYRKHPIIGDNLYNKKIDENLKLQAYSVSLYHPLKNEELQVAIPMRLDIKNYNNG